MMVENLRRKITGEPYDAKVSCTVRRGAFGKVHNPLTIMQLAGSLLYYNDRGGSIGLAIYDDRMEIFNSGGLLPGVTLEKIKEGYSKLRYPLIADVFYRCNLIEKWGRGIKEIISSCKSAHDPAPEFLVDEMEFKIIFRFPLILKLTATTDFTDELTKRQKEIINLLSASEEMKIKEIQQKIKEPIAISTLRDDLTALRKLGIVDSRGRARQLFGILIKGKSD